MDHEEHSHPHRHSHPAVPAPVPDDSLDAANRSLSEALRISFVILKVIMIVLVLAFLASGFKTVDPDEKAMVLRFGKIRLIGDTKLLDPGAKWVLPYPIDEMIKIPVERKVNLAINSFWYKQDSDDILGARAKPRNYMTDSLDPVFDGYGLTRSGAQAGQVGRGSDYNIVHSKWQVVYRVQDAEQFFKNVYIPEIQPGQVYADVMTKNVEPLLRSVVEDAVVDTLVEFTIDEAIKSHDRIPIRVRQLAQRKLRDIGGGIAIDSVQIVDVNSPQQVNEAFQAFHKASNDSAQDVSKAKTEATNLLNETAGAVAEALYAALTDDVEGEDEALWDQLAGEARRLIDEAQAYRIKVVNAAKANADYLLGLLDEYRKRPDLVAQDIYLDTIEQVLGNAEEVFVIEGSEGAKESEVRIMLNRDPKIKPKSGQTNEQNTGG